MSVNDRLNTRNGEYNHTAAIEHTAKQFGTTPNEVKKLLNNERARINAMRGERTATEHAKRIALRNGLRSEGFTTKNINRIVAITPQHHNDEYNTFNPLKFYAEENAREIAEEQRVGRIEEAKRIRNAEMAKSKANRDAKIARSFGINVRSLTDPNITGFYARGLAVRYKTGDIVKKSLAEAGTILEQIKNMKENEIDDYIRYINKLYSDGKDILRNIREIHEYIIAHTPSATTNNGSGSITKAALTGVVPRPASNVASSNVVNSNKIITGATHILERSKTLVNEVHHIAAGIINIDDLRTYIETEKSQLESTIIDEYSPTFLEEHAAKQKKALAIVEKLKKEHSGLIRIEYELASFEGPLNSNNEILSRQKAEITEIKRVINERHETVARVINPNGNNSNENNTEAPTGLLNRLTQGVSSLFRRRGGKRTLRRNKNKRGTRKMRK